MVEHAQTMKRAIRSDMGQWYAGDDGIAQAGIGRFICRCFCVRSHCSSCTYKVIRVWELCCAGERSVRGSEKRDIYIEN
jgi:hypothetical protein